jgi:hypothetical protein
MKTSTHYYRGYVITGFNLRQLGDSSVRGMSYNVYGVGGGESLLAHECLTSFSAHECLTSLSEAKQFVDKLDATS